MINYLKNLFGSPAIEVYIGKIERSWNERDECGVIVSTETCQTGLFKKVKGEKVVELYTYCRGRKYNFNVAAYLTDGSLVWIK